MTYNGRHLVTQITYSAPSPISVTPTTTYTYDAAGNRKSMSDASGTTTFQYSSLSQMTSEVRTFTGLSGSSFTLSYEYTLGGNLKSLTGHDGKKVNYGYDKTGRLNTVTGTNYQTTDFIDSVDYRAWNSPQQVVYGHGRPLNYTYNNRLAITNLEMPAVPGSLAAVMDKDYEYYNDRRVKYSRDNLDGRFDRSFEFDHVGRLVKAKSGAEARGEGTTTDRPYNQFFTYDAFNHLAIQNSRHWSKSFPYISNDTYTNNRRTGWTYDADGNLLNDLKRTFTFDAAGKLIASSGGNVNQVFDGEGRRTKTIEPGLTTYYLISNVTGKVISHIDGNGTKTMGFIYALGGLLGEEFQNGFVGLVHTDASAISIRKTHSVAGNIFDLTELDPNGADVGTSDPYPEEPEFNGREEGGPLYPGFGNVSNPGNCTVDGIWMPCDMANRMLGSGAAVMVPEDGLMRYNHETKQFEFFRAYADGFSGYLPADARYNGNGIAFTNNPAYGRFDDRGYVIEIQKTPTHIVNDSIAEQAVKDCVEELYPIFKAKSFKQATAPTSSNDSNNGTLVAQLEGKDFSVVSDVTPPPAMVQAMKDNGAVGATPTWSAPAPYNPFWTFTCLSCANYSNFPGQKRYPELYKSRPYLWNQIHELGAALTLIREKYDPIEGPELPRGPLPHNGLYPGGHGDDGPAMEECVGRRYYNQTGLKPGP